MPNFGVFTDNGDGTGLLECDPRCGDADAYPMTVTLTDGEGLTNSEDFTLTVTASPEYQRPDQVGGVATFLGGDGVPGGTGPARWWLLTGGAAGASTLLSALAWYRRGRLPEGPDSR